MIYRPVWPCAPQIMAQQEGVPKPAARSKTVGHQLMHSTTLSSIDRV